ncbi:hypothetical protein V8C44DRAFT_29269 [Trichoderma aethiopicum]
MAMKGQDATAAQTQRRVVPKERGGGKRKGKKEPGEEGCKSEGEKRKSVEREKKRNVSRMYLVVACGLLEIFLAWDQMGSSWTDWIAVWLEVPVGCLVAPISFFGGGEQRPLSGLRYEVCGPSMRYRRSTALVPASCVGTWSAGGGI